MTRRSTSGTALFFGSHLISFSSRLQKSVALSSGEAELTAQVSGLAEGLGIRSVLSELGVAVRVAGECDSSAARGVLSRIGSGKIRHLEVKHLWVQEWVAK